MSKEIRRIEATIQRLESELDAEDRRAMAQGSKYHFPRRVALRNQLIKLQVRLMLLTE